MIRSIKGAPLLLGARGSEARRYPGLGPDAVAALPRFRRRLAGPRLLAVDLNPVFAMPDGRRCLCCRCLVIELAAES